MLFHGSVWKMSIAFHPVANHHFLGHMEMLSPLSEATKGIHIIHIYIYIHMFYSHVVFVVSGIWCMSIFVLYVYIIYIYILWCILVYMLNIIYIHISIQYIYTVLHSPQASSISSTFWDAFRYQKPPLLRNLTRTFGSAWQWGVQVVRAFFWGIFFLELIS